MPRKIDYDLLARLHAEGQTYSAMARRFNCSRGGIRHALRQLGLRRPRGWKPVGYGQVLSNAMRNRKLVRV